MKTASEVMSEAARRGVVLGVKGDQLSWRAPAGAMTSDLIEAMKMHKAAIRKALQGQDIIARQRYGRFPDSEIPLTLHRPMLSDQDAELLTAFIDQQPPPVVRWVVSQADRYDVAAPHWQPPAVREQAAMLDCLLWQWGELASIPAPNRTSRYDRVQAAVRLLRHLDEANREATAFFERTQDRPDRPPTGKPAKGPNP